MLPPEQTLGRLPSTLMFGKVESWEAIPGRKTQVKGNNWRECPGTRTHHLAMWCGAVGLPHPTEPLMGTVGLCCPEAAPMLSDVGPGNSP